MTISSTTNRMDYTGAGGTSVYPYTFRIFSATDLLVTRLSSDGTQSTLSLNVDYSVSGVGNLNGGNVTLLAGNLASGDKLAIRRVRPLLQDTDIRNQGDFFPEVHEDTFDKLVMIDQQQEDEISRSMRLPETIPASSVSVTLPVPSPNQVLGWNGVGSALVNVAPGTLLTVAGSQNQIVDVYTSAHGDFTAGSTTSLTLSNAPGAKQNVMITFNGVVQAHSTFSIVGAVVTFTAAIPNGTTVVEAQYMTTLAVGTTASENVSYVQAGSGAVSRNVRDRLRDIVNVKDFGAVGDGVTNDTAAIQAAIDAVTTSSGFDSTHGATIYVPPGIFQVSNLVLPPACALIGASRQTSVLRGINGSTGYMITDNGNAAKIILDGFACWANNCNYSSVIRLGYGGGGQWGSEGYIQNVWIRDCPNVGLDINANVGLVRGVSIWNIGTGVMNVGNGTTFHDIFVAGIANYGIYSSDGFFYGIELEAPATGAIPFYMSRQNHVYGATVSLANGTSIDTLFKLEDNNVVQSTISGLTVYKTGTGDYTSTVTQDGLIFGKQTPYSETSNFQFSKRSPQLVVIDDAYASARSYTITVKATHPDCVFALYTDVAEDVTFDFSDTVGNFQGRRFKIVNNTAAKTCYVKGNSAALFIATQLLYTNINYDLTKGLPVRHGCTLDFGFHAQRGSSQELGILTHPEEDLSAIPQGKYWQGEVIHQKANLVSGTSSLAKIVVTTGYVIKEAWTTGHSYTAGDFVSNGGNVYKATTSGTAGASAPVHLTGTVSDGTVSWLFLESYTAVVYKTLAVS